MKEHSMTKRAVLGIDAAWTVSQPSGVALAVETEGGWRLAAVEASYGHFVGRANGDAPGERPHGSKPDAAMLLGAARQLCGRRVDLVAVDMPMARRPIVGRRPCDTAISKRYGGKGAATHSPSAERPGKVSDALRTEFEALGYRLCTALPARGLIEVYPHPALIEFMNETRRLAYKAGKTLIYWPDVSSDNRRLKLRAVWGESSRRSSAGSRAQRRLCRHRRTTSAVGASKLMRTSSTPWSAPRSPSRPWTGRRNPTATKAQRSGSRTALT